MSDLVDLRVRTRNEYQKIDPNAKVWDNNTLDFYINEAYKKVQRDVNFEVDGCQDSTIITTVAGTAEYNKPADFQKLTGLYDGTYQLTPTTKQVTMTNRASSTKPSSYYIYGGKIGLYPTPDTTYTIDLLYNKFLPKLTNTQGTEISEDFDEAISLYACYLSLLSVEKQQKAGLVLAQYNTCINGLFGQNLNDDDGISFGIQRNTTDRPRDDAL